MKKTVWVRFKILQWEGITAPWEHICKNGLYTMSVHVPDDFTEAGLQDLRVELDRVYSGQKVEYIGLKPPPEEI